MNDHDVNASSDSDNSKRKFLEALEKKKSSGGIRNNQKANKSRIVRGQTSGNTPKMFRRKSAST